MYTAPLLSVSTNLLVALAQERSVQVSCTPSDPLAPVRWRTLSSTYDQLSSSYRVQFSDPLRQIATFTQFSYESVSPDRTDIFLCDLVNVDEPDSNVEIDPQMITVRYISSKYVICTS